MTQSGTRRGLFKWTKTALLTAGFFRSTQARADTTANPTSTEGEDYYDKLGVTKIINAAGTYTMFTGSILAPPVQAAVARAAKHPVRLAELQQKAGEYIARRLKCEAALV